METLDSSRRRYSLVLDPLSGNEQLGTDRRGTDDPADLPHGFAYRIYFATNLASAGKRRPLTRPSLPIEDAQKSMPPMPPMPLGGIAGAAFGSGFSATITSVVISS